MLIIPLGNEDNTVRRHPWVTYALLAANFGGGVKTERGIGNPLGPDAIGVRTRLSQLRLREPQVVALLQNPRAPVVAPFGKRRGHCERRGRARDSGKPGLQARPRDVGERLGLVGRAPLLGMTESFCLSLFSISDFL